MERKEGKEEDSREEWVKEESNELRKEGRKRTKVTGGRELLSVYSSFRSRAKLRMSMLRFSALRVL